MFDTYCILVVILCCSRTSVWFLSVFRVTPSCSSSQIQNQNPGRILTTKQKMNVWKVILTIRWASQGSEIMSASQCIRIDNLVSLVNWMNFVPVQSNSGLHSHGKSLGENCFRFKKNQEICFESHKRILNSSWTVFQRISCDFNEFLCWLLFLKHYHSWSL